MNLKTAKFVVSNQNVKDCPSDKIPCCRKAKYIFNSHGNLGTHMVNLLNESSSRDDC
jgi:hypothetical protein